MNVYDFDHTIYKSDSTVDFYFFCIKKHPHIVCFLPIQIKGILFYKLGKYTKEQMKEDFFSFLKGIRNIDCDIEEFIEKNCYKISKWYLDAQLPSDVIISASPRFLIEKFSEKSTGFTVIASEVNKKTGKFESKNCYGKEKVTRFQERFGNEKIDSFFSDSDSDLPMAQLAMKAYKVEKNQIKKWHV